MTNEMLNRIHSIIKNFDQSNLTRVMAQQIRMEKPTYGIEDIETMDDFMLFHGRKCNSVCTFMNDDEDMFISIYKMNDKIISIIKWGAKVGEEFLDVDARKIPLPLDLFKMVEGVADSVPDEINELIQGIYK